MKKIFKLNKDGNIEFTKDELKKLLDEVFDQGYEDGKNSNYIWNSPWHYQPYWSYNTISTTSTSTGNTLTIDEGKLNQNTIVYSTEDITSTPNKDWNIN